MNKTLWLSRILTAGGILETATGLALLAAPAATAFVLLRAPLEGVGPIVARIGGGGLLAVGIACWFARNPPATPAGLGVARGFLAYNMVACVVLALACPPMPGGIVALAAAVAHGLLAAALLGILLGGGPRDA